MSNTIKAGFYIIKQDEEGNVLLFLPAFIGNHKNPIIVYDGKDHAVFSRNSELNIILDYINPEIREIFTNAQEVFVVEAEGKNIKESYKSKVKIVDNMPIQWEKYGLKTWNEAIEDIKEEYKDKV